jgi:hypothetical protein
MDEAAKLLQQQLDDMLKNFGSSFSTAAGQIAGGAANLTTALANGQQGASVFNGTIQSAGQALTSLLGPLGALGTAFGKLGEFAGMYLIKASQQSDALFKSFQDLSRVGGAGAEGMTGVFDNMQKFGLSMNQLPEFGAMIAQNSEALANLSGSVSQGTKKFAEVAAGIEQSGLQSEFLRMGLKVKDINEGTANYLRIQTLTGASAQKSQEALTAGAAEYITQQDKLSRLTGKSAESLAKEEEARLSDQRYAAVTRELEQKAAAARAAGDEDGAKAAEDQIKQNRELMAQTPAALKQGVQDLMSGFVNSPEAKKMYTSLPEMSQAILSQNYQASEVLTKGATEASGALNRNVGLAKAGISNSVNADYAGMIALEAKNRQKTASENEADVKKAQDDLKSGKDLDINNQVALRQAQTATTIAMDNLVQKGVRPVTAKLLELAGGIEKVITKLPETGEKTSIKERSNQPGSGRGVNTPSVAGYGTNFKTAEAEKFIKDSVSKASKAIGNLGQRDLTPQEQVDRAKPNSEPVNRRDTRYTPKLTDEDKQKLVDKVKPNPAPAAPQAKPAEVAPQAKPAPVAPQAKPAEVAPQAKPATPQAKPAPVAPTSGYIRISPPDQFAKPDQSLAGPNTSYRTTLDNSRPDTERETKTNTGSNNETNPELTQGIMELAKNIELQTASTNELVDLMRRSVNTQGKILQQSRN